MRETWVQGEGGNLLKWQQTLSRDWKVCEAAAPRARAAARLTAMFEPRHTASPLSCRARAP